ncbi:class I SAM-dependent methyltransferase [Candidatus Thioglobus sp.]|nr:class I SAM-dependent methyltransferase [Candidatus Thioglobus sp.]
MSLPIDDKTPKYFTIHSDNILEKIKRPIRKLLYPVLTKITELNFKKSAEIKDKIGCDKVYIDQRGNDYEAHRARVNQYKKIKDCVVLIIGAGTGKDLESWLKYHPKKIIALDQFNYKRAWEIRAKSLSQYSDSEIEFIQADILDLSMIADSSIDIIGSDAVFAHINKFDEALSELYRVLKKDGKLYATYGPLWYCWAGDHVSGKDNIENGYNHITLTNYEYEIYIDSFGNYSHNEEDGRTWVKNKLFSYLKPVEYLSNLNDAGFNKVYSSVIIESRAIDYSNSYPNEFKALEDKHGYENLIVTGMTIIHDKQ